MNLIFIENHEWEEDLIEEEGMSEEEDDDDEEEEEMEVEEDECEQEMEEISQQLPSTVKNKLYGALFRAVERGDFETVMLNLLFALSDVSDKRSLLQMSVQNRHSRMTLFFLKKGAPIEYPPDSLNEDGPLFHQACRHNSVEVIQEFIKRGALVEQKDPLGKAPLHYAVEGGNNEVVELLAAQEVSVNEMDNQGCTPFYLAVKSRHMIWSSSWYHLELTGV